jgi:hypothetical protein
MNPRLAFAVLLSLSANSVWGTTPSWQEKMKSLGDTVTDLLPELVSSQGNPEAIEKGAKALSELSHDLKAGQGKQKLVPPADNDPTIGFLADQFSEQTGRAYKAIKQGQVAYGKDLLRSVTSYCIACHSRHDNGPAFAAVPTTEKANRLSKEEKAALYVALRQFDKGLAEYRQLVADPELLKKRPFDWERYLRQAIAIAVRVKKDPQLASELISAALQSPDLAVFQTTQLKQWQKAVEAWKKEPPIKVNTEAGHTLEMRRLFREAIAGQQLMLDNHSTEIQFLRASAAAHEVLRVARDPKTKAEAFMVAGKSYESLINPLFWPMHEFFYEACVRQLPHSEIAQQCYSSYVKSVYFGYTGSAGTYIPEDVQQLLGRLGALAEPKPKKAKGQSKSQ